MNSICMYILPSLRCLSYALGLRSVYIKPALSFVISSESSSLLATICCVFLSARRGEAAIHAKLSRVASFGRLTNMAPHTGVRHI